MLNNIGTREGGYFKAYSDRNDAWLVKKIDRLNESIKCLDDSVWNKLVKQDCFEQHDEILREFLIRERLDLYHKYSKEPRK